MNDFIIGDNLELESFFKQNANALHEQNPTLRKTAITQIYQKVTDPNIAQSDSLSQQILLKYGKVLLKAFSDTNEKVREMSIKSMIEYQLSHIPRLITNSEDNEPILSYVFSVLIERSNCQDLEGISHLPEVMRPPPSQLPTRLMKFVEESEEIRLLLIQFLYSIMCKNDSDNLHEYIDDIVDIHRAFLMDPFGEVQREACKSLGKFCKVNHQMLLHFTEKMGRAILHPLVNKKSPVRIAALEALSAVLLCGVWKNNAFVFEILTGFKDPNSVPIKAFFEPMHHINYFATLIIDPKQQVRQAFIKEIGFWLRGLADRWDHHPRLVPYLLSGLFDSDPSIQEAALQIIEDVGKEWEIEKEKDIKNVRQLGIEPAWILDGKLSQLPLPPPFKERPKLGMRGFIKNQVRKMWPAIYKEIVDNNEENRLRASHLMTLGVLFSEDYMTQFLDNFIPNTIMAIKPGQTKIEKNVQLNLQKTYQLLGRFCDYTSYSFIIFSSMRGRYIRDEQYIRSATQALSWLCQGAIEATFQGIGTKMELLSNIVDLLCENSMIESISTINYLEIQDLLNTVKKSIEKMGTQDEVTAFNEKYQYQLNLLDNVINYIQNFNAILLNQQIQQTQKLQYSERVRLLKADNFKNDFLFGDSGWKNVISELIHQLHNGSTQAYHLTDLLYDFILPNSLPEPCDFILKLTQLLLQSFEQQHSQLYIQIILKLCAIGGQWLNSLQQKQFTQKLLDNLLVTFKTISGHLSKKRDIGKAMCKDQLSLDYYTRTVIALCGSYQKFYRKQYNMIVVCVSEFCNLFLPYPSSKHLLDSKNQKYLLPNLQLFCFDAIDQYGGEQNQETRKHLFSILSYINQFIPVQETYLGDAHVIENYQKYLQQLLRLCIEEKDLQFQDLYKIMIKELCNKTRNNFLQELEIAKHNNQLSRVELLYVIINQ